MTDNLTHTLFSYFIGIIIIRLLKLDEKQKFPLIVAMVAGNLPDIDFVLRFFGALFYLSHHRVYTHSVLGIILLAVALALIVKYVFKKKESFKYFLLALIAIIGHVFLDLITSFGTEVFYPISSARLAYSLIPIVDVYVLLIFFTGLWFMKIEKRSKVKVAKATLFIFFVFLIFKAGLHTLAKEQTEGLKDYQDVEVVPHFFNPFGWKAIVTKPDYYLMADFDLTTGGFKGFEWYPILEKDKVEASKESVFVRQFLEFAKSPYPIVEGNKVTWIDLRVTEGKFTGMKAVVDLDENNILKKSEFGL
ncbi:metal-dependent hydrolase [Candidatus Woesearchaeota archaeon]|nr:MAG: metal-dependent hydrolase [Candidatus Woesearchaeota archaeon]